VVLFGAGDVVGREIAPFRGEARQWTPAATGATKTSIEQGGEPMTTVSDQAVNEARVRAVIDDRARALRAKDTAGVLHHHAPGFVQFSLAPPLTSTADREELEAWFATWRGPLGYEVHHLSVTAGDDAAFSHSLNRMSGTKVDGEKPSLWFRDTLGFRRIGGEWKITHEHESVPFYMDGSFKAAIDLTP
jgi:PhnB protein